jgi:ABC-2 type transport system ATP-binding protein
MPVEDATAEKAAPSRPGAPGADAPLAIQVEHLHKAFQIPTQRVDSLKERAMHPFAAREHRELRALDDISFEVRQGEFFGIVGRNGSGKSTLLKLLASIYAADAGRIRIAGRLAPFIELGVGFNAELTARENVVLNGVMMGLTPRETRQRLGAVIEFAELEEFADLKLKNYSSGMQVRLAFSVMLEADADVLLIDEVLAVGDASFQQKCADAFHQMKKQGKTIVLVTHEMSSVDEYCHRALLIADGKIQHIGDPAEVGRHYLQLNFERDKRDKVETAQEFEANERDSDEVRLLDVWLEDDRGERISNVEHGARFRLRAEVEALVDMDGLAIGFSLANADGIGVADFGALPERDGAMAPLAAGERITISAEIDNLLNAGHYFVHIGFNRAHGAGVALYVHEALDFVVFGGDPHRRGIVSLPLEVETTTDRDGR